MLTSRRNWESGSAVQPGAGSGAGADAATPPAQSASSIAALRSQLLPPAMRMVRSPAPPLAQHRLRFCDHVAAVVEGFDILDGDGAGRVGQARLIHRNGDMANSDFRIDRDPLLDRDRSLRAGLKDPHFTKGGALS